MKNPCDRNDPVRRDAWDDGYAAGQSAGAAPQPEAARGEAPDWLTEVSRAVHATGAYRCEACGEYVAKGDWHSRAEHAPRCDGYTCAPDCPVEVQCGPVVEVTDELIRKLPSTAPAAPVRTAEPDPSLARHAARSK